MCHVSVVTLPCRIRADLEGAAVEVPSACCTVYIVILHMVNEHRLDRESNWWGSRTGKRPVRIDRASDIARGVPGWRHTALRNG